MGKWYKKVQVVKMMNGFNQKVNSVGNLTGLVQNTPFSFGSMQPLDSTEGVKSVSFKDTMGGLAQNLNQGLNAPDKLLKGAMAGDEGVDIHDVMTAMAKAEMTVSVATQVTSKVIQAYDKIMQISV